MGFDNFRDNRLLKDYLRIKEEQEEISNNIRKKRKQQQNKERWARYQQYLTTILADKMLASAAGGKALLLDLFPNPAAAYSLRKIRTAYTGNAIRVRKEVSLVDDETDIGFDKYGNLDTSALLSFASNADGGNVYVTIWYDQSVNDNRATNSNESYQPLIVDGGTLVTDTDGDASIYNFVNGALVKGLIPSYDQINSQAYSLFVVAEIDSSSDRGMLLGDNSTGGNFLYASDNGDSNTTLSAGYTNVSSFIDGSTFSPTTRDDIHTGMHKDVPILVSAFYDTSTSFGGTDDYPRILGYSGATQYMAKNKIKEWILFESDQSSNRTGIEGNINSFYEIYN